MVNDEESRHALVSEETPLLADTSIEETTAAGAQNGSGNDDNVAPTPLSGKRAVVVAFAVACLLFIQGMISAFGALQHGYSHCSKLPILQQFQQPNRISLQISTLSPTRRG